MNWRGCAPAAVLEGGASESLGGWTPEIPRRPRGSELWNADAANAHDPREEKGAAGLKSPWGGFGTPGWNSGGSE